MSDQAVQNSYLAMPLLMPGSVGIKRMQNHPDEATF